jgi:threonine/homoserine/homoserine lactone efflux protein
MRLTAMTLTQTAFVILGLLLTPGPTNSLLAIAGAERGWARALRLVPAEVAGYLATTLPLALVGAHLLEAAPQARAALTTVAGLWVLWLALSMWRLPGAGHGGLTVTGRHVFVTTLLNPKALVFGLVLLPAEETARLVAQFGTFVALVVGVAMGWAALGAGLRLARPGGDAGLPGGWRRAASVWLGALGMYLLGHVAGLA